LDVELLNLVIVGLLLGLELSIQIDGELRHLCDLHLKRLLEGTNFLAGLTDQKLLFRIDFLLLSK